MFSQLGALGGCIEDARVECWFGRDLDGSVPYEQWSVLVVPNEEANPWSIDVGSYGQAAATAAGLLARGGEVREGPFPVTYYELGSRAEPTGGAPKGLTFTTHHGTALEYPDGDEVYVDPLAFGFV